MSIFSHTSKENPYLPDPDVQLMLKFQRGDKASFEQLMEKHYKRIFNLTLRFVGSREAAEDLTQDIFIKIYKAAETYKPQAKLQTWIYQIARNASLNALRSLRKQPVSLDQPVEGSEDTIQKQTPDLKSLDPRQEAEKAETIDLVKEAISTLPENQRMAVILRRYENLSYEDIAKTMNCSIEALKSLLNRAKENLKDKLASTINGNQYKD